MRQNFIEQQMDAFIEQNTKRYRNLKGPLTLHEGIDLAIHEWTAQGKAPNTIDTYVRHLREFSTFAHKKFQHPNLVQRMDRFCIASYRTFLAARRTEEGAPLSPRSVQIRLDSLRAF
ncbi:site-specific integrase, partial [Alicyclobacillus shizuokensis]|uniref:site-specific integrase n=1 Tax=Alicyclobacillus shizuokensis TaxID=392014 RepID=UPI000B0044C6